MARTPTPTTPDALVHEIFGSYIARNHSEFGTDADGWVLCSCRVDADPTRGTEKSVCFFTLDRATGKYDLMTRAAFDVAYKAVIAAARAKVSA